MAGCRKKWSRLKACSTHALRQYGSFAVDCSISCILATMVSSILASFIGSLQASISVLLTIFYGVVGAQFNLLDDKSAKKVSSICVKLFLPSLLLTNIGSQLDIESGGRYLRIIIWSVLYNVLSLAFGTLATRLFGLPRWVTPAITFNNTTAMPLLLIQSLGETSILKSILWGADDTVPLALARAKSYFLVNSMVANILTFGLGPNLLGTSKEQAKESLPSPPLKTAYGTGLMEESGGEVGLSESEPLLAQRHDEEIQNVIRAHEETSLLPKAVVRVGTSASLRSYRVGKRYYDILPRHIRVILHAGVRFVSAPLVGAAIGVFIGLVPPLKTLFFSELEEGGYFKAWLTTAVRNCGELFATLQVVVVGVKLSQSLLAMKKGTNSGSVPLRPMVFVFIVRFILWPAISIPIVWVVADRTGVLSGDPMLTFALMIMPTGPPALKLQALADVVGSTDDEKMAMAKFLTISYAVCPLMSFAVVGALKASQELL